MPLTLMEKEKSPSTSSSEASEDFFIAINLSFVEEEEDVCNSQVSDVLTRLRGRTHFRGV